MSVTYPRGFAAAGVACGIKPDGASDLALVVSDGAATAAGVFTRNLVRRGLRRAQRVSTWPTAARARS